MLSHQLRNSGTLLDSIDAIRNWRAVGLLLTTFLCMALVVSVAGLVGQFSYFLASPFVLLAYVIFFYGANAVGMMMMDEARGGESRHAMEAVAASVATSHRLILVFLLLGALYLAGFVALAVVLFICKLPFIGPVLYTVVFPVSVVVAGTAMFAVPTVIFPLSAPAIWGGAGIMACISQLLVIVRERLVMVLVLMLAVSFMAGMVGLLIGAIVFTGVAATAVVSVPILGGMPGVLPAMSGMGLAGVVMAGSGHALAAAIGGALLFAVAFTLPGMVYLRGASSVYLRAIDGLDLVSEQALMDERIAAATARAREMQAKAQAAAQKYTAAPAAPPPTAPIEPKWIPPASTPGTDPHTTGAPTSPPT
ncbi:hypothetical protein RD110_10485 [Rhodoferax koreense]|uniref:Uncharacterized protein n=1 Tax=Rhodoferax koreensis TaxID=1842727 RepID=A0A1P8JUW2_9BURK|nr:hypothetical protein [Rhodoferax koreense]APW37560.1 hypothetical protein RD110_10485 [Rhodoferax koreense]